MHGMMDRTTVVSRHRGRRHAGWKATVKCEVLEERTLLSGLGGPGAIGLWRFAGGRDERVRGRPARRDVWRGFAGPGWGDDEPDPPLVGPLLEGGSGSTTPPSPSVMSSSAVQTAFQTLQTDLKNDIPSGAQPTHASVGALEDTLDAIRKGTLTGTAAQTQIQSDQAAILTSMGLTQAQITQIQTDQTALQTAISSASTDDDVRHDDDHCTTFDDVDAPAPAGTVVGRSDGHANAARRTFKMTRPAELNPPTPRSARSRMTWMRSAKER